ncbi:MAG: DUF3332 family protein [Elusimicrobiota bacterium]
MLKKSWIPVVLAATVAVAGCYGPFRLTKKLHQWNGEVGEKWAKEAVFLGMVIFPVYFFATLGDAVVFNSLEFWTGNNPITAKRLKSIRAGDEQAVLTYRPDERRLRVDTFDKGKHLSTVMLEPGPEGMVARDGRGRLLAGARTDGQTVIVRDPAGGELGRYGESDLRRLADR